MDARISKERLSNLLSYDWIKMIVSVIAAVLVFSLLFTSLKTQPGDAQEFTVYFYQDVQVGSDFSDLPDKLLNKNIFSYEILDTTAESFYGNSYADTVFTARRAAGLGDVLILSDEEVLAEDGSVATESTMRTLLDSYTSLTLNVESYLSDCANYLNGFFGDYRTGTLDEAKAEETFYARNSKDKRYKTDEQKQAGVEEEKARLLKLRDDYIAVEDSFANGYLSYTYYAREGEEEFACAIDLSHLSGVTRLCYTDKQVDEEEIATAEYLRLMLFNNGVRDGDAAGDLRYESVSFLRYLVDTYANA